MQTLRLTLIAATIAAAPAAALAHDTAPIDRTRAHQLYQIEEGRRTGALTAREYERLVSEQARIAEMQRRARADGVTARQFKAIRSAQLEAAASISEETTNRRVNLWRKLRTRHGS